MANVDFDEARARATPRKPASITTWERGRIVDGFVAPGGWSWVLAVLLLVLVFDGLLSFAPRGVEAVRPSAGQARETLERAVAGKGNTWLLLGDSVLAGDVLEGRVEGWERLRVVDALRAEAEPSAGVSFEQVALDGVLPVDMLHVVEALDHLDPHGRTPLLVEFNPRYFSKHYGAEVEGARAELRELVELVAGEGLGLRWLEAQAGRWTPVVRHRDALRAHERVGALSFHRSKGAQPDVGEGEALVRLLEHYRTASVRWSGHAQVRALEEMLERAGHRGRRVVVFITPVEDRFAESAGNLPLLYGDLARLVHDRGGELIAMDHPVFDASRFVDHVHLMPDGNRVLALNLLHQIGVPLRAMPRHEEMVHPEGHDRSLMARVERQFQLGAAWEAGLESSGGIGVSDDGRDVVIADRRAHVLMRLRGRQQVFEHLAGVPFNEGHGSGTATRAALREPRSPLILGDAVYFLSDDRLRVVVDGRVSDVHGYDRKACPDPVRLRGREGHERIYVQCKRGGIVVHDLERGVTSKAHRHGGKAAEPRHRVRSFDIGPLGDELFYLDREGRIWSEPLDEAGEARRDVAPVLHFANDAEKRRKWKRGKKFPVDFDEYVLFSPTDLRYLDRYGALLVQDEIPPNRGDEDAREAFTERVQLRVFDLDRQRVYPWLKPIPHGDGHVMWNEPRRTVAGYFHRGHLALARETSTLFYLERNRSRLLRIEDGLLGAYKVGDHQSRAARVELYNPFGSESGAAVGRRFRPDRYFDRRPEPVPRAGPYVGLFVGSSMAALSDRIGNYSYARRLEVELQRELGYRAGVRFDLVQRTQSAARFDDLRDLVAGELALGLAPDLIIVELQSFSGKLLRDVDGQDGILERLVELQRLAAEHGSSLILVDISGLVARRRDGLRTSPRDVAEVVEVAESLGIAVISPTNRLLPELLTDSPWGNQDWRGSGHHGAPWAIDHTARVLAQALYPHLVARAEAGPPVRRAPRRAAGAEHEGPALGEAFEAHPLAETARIDVDTSHVSHRFREGHLEITVDERAAPSGGSDPGELDAVALSVLEELLVHDVYGSVCYSASLSIVRYDGFDEYGAGVLDSAERLWERELDHDALLELLESAG